MIYDKHLGKEFKFSLQKHIYIPVTSYSLDNIDMGNSLICQKNQHDPDQWKYIELIITFSIRQYSNPSHQRPPLLRVLHMEQELLTLPECLSFQLFFICIGGVRVINFVNLHVFMFLVPLCLSQDFCVKTVFGLSFLPFILSGVHVLLMLFVLIYIVHV